MQCLYLFFNVAAGDKVILGINRGFFFFFFFFFVDLTHIKSFTSSCSYSPAKPRFIASLEMVLRLRCDKAEAATTENTVTI